MKRCARCGERKPLNAFNRQAKSQDGRQAHCRPCKQRLLLELRARRRREAMLVYGDGSCASCGHVPADLCSLELDHVDGDGAEHRKAIPGGNNLPSRLRRLGWPKEPRLQTLCHDCHTEKSRRERAATQRQQTELSSAA
jgi:DNA-directed RNA polymerase subunit RPC12/RpoP